MRGRNVFTGNIGVIDILESSLIVMSNSFINTDPPWDPGVAYRMFVV